MKGQGLGWPLRALTQGRQPCLVAGIVLIYSEIRNELRNIKALRRGRVPGRVKAEGKTVVALISIRVGLELDGFRVVAVLVSGDVGLCELERGWALQEDIGHLIDCALRFVVVCIPAREGSNLARVVLGSIVMNPRSGCDGRALGDERD